MGRLPCLQLRRNVRKGIGFIWHRLGSSVDRPRLELCSSQVEMERNVQGVQPDHRLHTAMHVLVPTPGGRDNQVADLHRAWLSVDNGKRTASFEDKTQGVHRVSMWPC